MGGPQASCTGEANKIIGESANAQLGYYLKNITPGAPGNPLVKPNTVILNPGRVPVNNSANQPNIGGPPPIGNLFYTFTDFPTNVPAPFTNRGEFKVHYDPGADEICFNLQKLINYTLDNLDVGGVQILPAVKTFPGRSTNKYIATQVRAQRIENEIAEPPAPLFVVNQHPSFFYYGRVLFFFPPTPGPGKIHPAEM